MKPPESSSAMLESEWFWFGWSVNRLTRKSLPTFAPFASNTWPRMTLWTTPVGL
jgi:hypothetical protein